MDMTRERTGVSAPLVQIQRPLLSDEQRQAIHFGALRTLEEIGIEVASAALQRQLAVFSGVDVKGGRVCFSGELIERLLDRPDPRPWEPPENHRIALNTGNGLFHTVDLETDLIRPMTWNDAIQGTRLADAMRAADVYGGCPGTPQDIPSEMYALAEYTLGALYSRNGGSFVSPCSLTAYEYLLRMHEVMGQDMSLPLYVLSPLRLAGESLDVVLHFLPNVRRFSASSMPTVGATAPIYIPAAFMQSLAESFAGLAVIKLLRPDAEVGFGYAIFPIDMKNGVMSYSAPEMSLWDMVRLEMAAFYGHPTTSGRFIRSMAKRPGVQAAAEKAASAVAGALAGVRMFNGAGKLSNDEVFSAEMLVIDREIADYAERFVWGIDLAPETFDLAVIEKGIGEGVYLGLESTVAQFRQTYWQPRLMERSQLSGWFAGGEEDMRARARAEVRRWMSLYDYELDADRAKALRQLYRAAARDIVGDTGLPRGRKRL
jgi:trimethylamine--corrinoid protein Co-methyltransferase